MENVSDSLRSDLEVEADNGVGSRPFQSLEQILRYRRVLDLSQCLNLSHKSGVNQAIICGGVGLSQAGPLHDTIIFR
jgi:hypothetical protein